MITYDKWYKPFGSALVFLVIAVTALTIAHGDPSFLYSLGQWWQETRCHLISGFPTAMCPYAPLSF